MEQVLSPVKLWTAAEAIKSLNSCEFECIAGPLKNNTAWQFLEKQAEVGPKFYPGQGVWFEVIGELSGIKLSKWVHFFVVGVFMAADSERRTWSYDLSYDPPAPYHYGTVHFPKMAEGKLFLERPQVPA